MVVLLDDILDSIWKVYYSQYVLPIIAKREEIDIYLDDGYINDNYINDNFMVYAVNYNILRVMSGMGGLTYSS